MHMLRPAGYNERRCIHRENLGLYGSIVVTGTYTLDTQERLSTLLLRDKVVKALKYCIDQHAALRTVIPDAEIEHPQLTMPHTLDLDIHLRMMDAQTEQSSDIESLQALLLDAHNEPYRDPSKHPSWRLYVQPLQSSRSPGMRIRSAFAYSHVLMDGGSGLVFHKTLLDALRNSSGASYESTSDHVLSETSPLPTALDQAAKFPISWSFLMAPLLGHILPKSIAHLAGLSSPLENGVDGVWLGASARPARPASRDLIQTCINVVQIPHETVQRALEQCRPRNARLTGVLHQLLARALHKHLPTRDGRHPTKFVASIPLDLRFCLSTVDASLKDCMASYSSGITETLEVPIQSERGESLTAAEWESAWATSEKLKAAASTLNDQPIALLSYISNIRGWVQEKAQKPAEASYEISNLGRFNNKTPELGQEQWHVCDMTFSQSADATGSAFSVNIISSNNAPMTLIFSWLPGALGAEDEQALIEAVSRSLVHGLENLV